MELYHFTQESLRRHLLALYDISTYAGGLNAGVRLNEAGERAADYLYDQMAAIGLHLVRKQPITVDRWWPEEYSLSARDSGGSEKVLDCFPLWYTSGITPTVLEVVDAGYGTPGELRGKNVRGKAVLVHMKRIFHFIQTFEKTGIMEKLVKLGAAAVIVINVLHDVPGGMLAISHKKVMACGGRNIPLYPLPALCIGKSDGQYLLDGLSKSGFKVKIHLSASVREAQAFNIISELPGNGVSNEVIVIGGHYDSWFGGALDNLASQGGILELARHFASIPLEQRPRKLVFASLFGHEFGNQGHAAFARELAGIKNHITCFYDLDGSGSTGWETDHKGNIIETGYNDVCGIVSSSNALSSLAYEALYHYGIFSMQFFNNAHIADLDGPISELGIPTLLIISKHLFYHTPLDTPELIPPEMVYQRMQVNRQIIHGLLVSEPGYYISTNTNPFREDNPDIPRRADITAEDLPANPRPWVNGPPKDLLFDIIPPNPRIFSPVIVWRGHFVGEGIGQISDITWRFGSLAEKILPKTRKGPATGTIFMTPGVKTVRMTVTDRYGRQSFIEREIEVSW